MKGTKARWKGSGGCRKEETGKKQALSYKLPFQVEFNHFGFCLFCHGVCLCGGDLFRRRCRIHCSRRGRSSLELEGLCHQRGIWADSLRCRRWFRFRGRGGFSRWDWRFHLPWTSSPRPLTRISVSFLAYLLFF